MGRYGGALAGVRPDDLGATTIEAAVERTGLDPERITDVYWGAANQAGEDNRDAARMCSLLAGLPVEVPGVTVNRLCASGLEAVNPASRALRLGEGDLYLAGGAESMSRAPWVVPKPVTGLPRGPETMHDTALGWRLDQPPHGRDALDRVDGRDGRERRRALQDLARGPGRLRPRKPPASRRRDREGRLRRRNRPDRGAARGEGGDAVTVDCRRGAAARRVARGAREAPAGVPRGRHA